MCFGYNYLALFFDLTNFKRTLRVFFKESQVVGFVFQNSNQTIKVEESEIKYSIVSVL